MVGVGFEPTKAKPADLQSAPFDRFGTPPATDPGPPPRDLTLPEQTKPPHPEGRRFQASLGRFQASLVS